MKKALSILLVLSFLLATLSSCGLLNSTKKEEQFYDLVSETQELLDIVADDIYSNWYDCIYKDKFSESIDVAIASAMLDNQDNLDKIEENNANIKKLYKEVKDGDLENEVKEVMQAYNEYYSFVVEVSGSFNSFSANKENLKKALATALKNLDMEL